MNMDQDSLSPWKDMPGFHFHTISYDWMHNCYLGTGRDLCASAIKVLVDYCGFGGGNDSGGWTLFMLMFTSECDLFVPSTGSPT